MAMFRFRLGRVLRVRAIEEEVARARWMEAANLAEEASRQAESLDAIRRVRQSELASLLGNPTIEPAIVVASHAALDRLAIGVRSARERARTLLFQAEVHRSPWEALRRARRSLELLREKKLEDHYLEDERAQAREIDEIASDRAARAPARNTRPAD